VQNTVTATKISRSSAIVVVAAYSSRHLSTKVKTSFINMTITHLSQGSVDPPVTSGKLRMYSMRFCPFAHRVHLVLNSKQVPYEPVYINLEKKPDWYLQKFPAGRVPALVFDDEFLYESALLSDFLDEQYPSPPLYKDGAFQKIKDKLLIDKFGKIPGIVYQIVVKGENGQALFDELLNEVTVLEKELSKRGTPYFGGSVPQMVDYMIWPWFERLAAAPLQLGASRSIPEESFPALTAWKGNMLKDAAVLKHYTPPEIFQKHYSLLQKGLPAYDGLI